MTTPASADVRCEILRAAATLFAAGGVSATSLDQIAAELGATKGKIYYHFGSKAELQTEVCKYSVRLMHMAVAPGFHAPGPPGDRLRRMARAHVLAMMCNRPYHRVVVQTYMGGSTSGASGTERAFLDDLIQMTDAYAAMFREVLAQGMEDGSMRRQNLSITLNSVLMMLNAPVFWYHPRPDETEAERNGIAEQVADMALGAVLSPAPG
ncbi:TetR family transcriptional regulator [Pukyongiella litopenaei]|nr:TetR family transcriptional regulator [Pukyongiella litopenaei]